MNLTSIALSSFVLGLSGAMMPGPLLTLTIAESARRGIWAGPLLVLGHALLEAALVILLFLGLAQVVERPALFVGIALLGGGMLAWMGWKMLRGLSGLSLKLEAETGSAMHPVTAGALVSLANPYFILWWVTIGLGYLLVAHEAGLVGVVVFFLGHILADLFWYALISGTVSYGKRFISDFHYRCLVGGCGLFLIGFGGFFILRGLQRLALVG